MIVYRTIKPTKILNNFTNIEYLNNKNFLSSTLLPNNFILVNLKLNS